MTEDPITGAISLRPTTALTSQVPLGPLVRAQPATSAGDVLSRFAVPLFGYGIAAIFLFPGAYGAVLAGVSGAVLGLNWVVPRVRSLWASARMRRCPVWDGAAAPPGGAVRVVGRVRALGDPFLTVGESQPVLYSHTRFPLASPTGWRSHAFREDVRGVFLEIELGPDASVRIAPEKVRLVGGARAVPEVGPEVRHALGAPWAGWERGKLRRRLLRSGDRVEAVGVVVREVNPQGGAMPGRGVPMLQWLTPAWDDAVWIRRLEGR
jgi:hypothetical protein